MTIALIGGGEFTDACGFDAELLDSAGTREVLVLTTASAFENPAKVLGRSKEHFASLGATVATLPVLRRADALDAGIVSALAQHRFVYLTDGSPMHLRTVLKETPLWDAIVAVERAGVVAASGAAAMLVTDPMYDPRGGAFTLGLGLVSPLTVMPAHESMSPERSRRTRELAPPHVPVVSLDTATALIRDASGWRQAGSGQVGVFLDRAIVGLDRLPR